MITTEQIRDGICQALKTMNPEEIYINLCPKNFKRPSFWLETVKTDTSDVNFCTIKVDAYFMVTCFVKQDARGNSDNRAITEMQEAVVNLFRAGYLKVADRALKVKASTAGYDIDRSYVNLQFEYFDDRPKAEDGTPLMGDLEFKIKKGD